MVKLETKLRHMEYFVMRAQNTTTEEKLELLEAIGEMKKKYKKLKKERRYIMLMKSLKVVMKIITILPMIIDTWKNTPKKEN